MVLIGADPPILTGVKVLSRLVALSCGKGSHMSFLELEHVLRVRVSMSKKFLVVEEKNWGRPKNPDTGQSLYKSVGFHMVLIGTDPPILTGVKVWSRLVALSCGKGSHMSFLELEHVLRVRVSMLKKFLVVGEKIGRAHV